MTAWASSLCVPHVISAVGRKRDMSEPDLDETLDDLRRYVTCQVRAGFMPVGEIPEAGVEYLADEFPPETLRPHAEAFTAEALAAHAEEARSWPSTTDCDRLDAAFAALEESGVLARQDYSCCQNCGHGELWDEMQAALEERPEVHGYTFYHGQDTDSAVEGEGVCLAYGAAEPGERAEVAVGHEVVAALEAQGLETEWDGTRSKRIWVRVDWRRRRD